MSLLKSCQFKSKSFIMERIQYFQIITIVILICLLNNCLQHFYWLILIVIKYHTLIDNRFEPVTNFFQVKCLSIFHIQNLSTNSPL